MPYIYSARQSLYPWVYHGIKYTSLPFKALKWINVGIIVMINARTIRELLDRGFSVSVTKSTGMVEKYHALKNGDLAITYSGIGVCMYCGRIARGRCTCSEKIETVSLTGGFRHINGIATAAQSAVIDKASKILLIEEVSNA